MRSITLICRKVAVVAAVWASPAMAQQVVQLWPDKAPGSESWTFAEQDTPRAQGGTHIADVSVPTLTIYLPPQSKATGTAVVIAPGGGMVGLEVPAYASGPAKWFNDADSDDRAHVLRSDAAQRSDLIARR